MTLKPFRRPGEFQKDVEKDRTSRRTYLCLNIVIPTRRRSRGTFTFRDPTPLGTRHGGSAAARGL